MARNRNHTEYVLWGQHNAHCGGQSIKIAGGTLGQCRAAMRQRKAERGWFTLAIVADAAAREVAHALNRSPDEKGTARLAADLAH